MVKERLYIVRLPGPIFLLNLVKSGGNHFFALNGRLGSLGPIPTGSGALRGVLNFLRALTRSRIDVLGGEIGNFSKSPYTLV